MRAEEPATTDAGPSDRLTVAQRLGVKFTPPPPAPAAAPAEEKDTTPMVSKLSETGYPLVVLPKMEVKEPKSKLTEEITLTDKGALELAKKQYLSPGYRGFFGPLSQLGGYYLNFLSIFGGWHPNDAEAMALYRQEKRLKMLSDVDDLIRLEEFDGTKSVDDLKKTRLTLDITSR